MPGYTMEHEHAVRQVGDAIEQAVRWKNGGDLGRLTGRVIRLIGNGTEFAPFPPRETSR